MHHACVCIQEDQNMKKMNISINKTKLFYNTTYTFQSVTTPPVHKKFHHHILRTQNSY